VGCPTKYDPAFGCSLGEALSQARAGDTVALATPGASGHYVGNWSVLTAGTSSAAPLTIEPALRVADPILDGNKGKSKGCQTTACNGPVLTIGAKVDVGLRGLTIEDAQSAANLYGGGIQNDRGGTLSVVDCKFSGNKAKAGAAIDNADGGGTGTILVSASTFSDNTGDNGGAINNHGTATVSGSTFSGNNASDGGAIDNGDNGDNEGTLTVSASSFSGNQAPDGGAIDNGDNAGEGTLTVSGSLFSGNQAPGPDVNESMNDVGPFTQCPCGPNNGGDGGAIDNGDNGGSGDLTVAASTFYNNSATSYTAEPDQNQEGNGDGGAIDNADPNGPGNGTVTISGSTFTNDSANAGGAIDNGVGGAVSVAGSTFSGNSAGDYGGPFEDGGAIDNGDALGNSLSGNDLATLTVAASTFSSNSAEGDGGAIDNGDSSNNGGDVGDVNNGNATVTVSSSTFSGEQPTDLDNGDNSGHGTVWAAADIFANSCANASQGAWHDLGYNVSRDKTCQDKGNADINSGPSLASLLGPLADNGGPTKTMLPLNNNPAFGLVPYNTSVTLGGLHVGLCPVTDQRGTPSTPGQACDAGAVQLATPPATTTTTTPPDYQFNDPDAMTVAGGDLIVANYKGNSVTELDASTGALVRVVRDYSPAAMAVVGDDLFVTTGFSGYDGDGSVTELDASTGAVVRLLGIPAYYFSNPHPDAMAVAGDDLFVGNGSGNGLVNAVNELDASTGAVVRVLSGPAYKFNLPVAMTVVGDDLFVGNGSGSSVTELDASTGALVRVLSSPAYKFSYPQAMAVAGSDLFVANATGNSVTELDASTGALVKVLSGPAYKFNGPEATAVAGDDLFVGNGGGSSVTELDAFTGALVKVLSGPAYKFNEPQGMAVAGGDLFVANGDGNSVTELDASTGALVRVLSGPTATERASLGSFL
jgi:hypothetical protein